MIPLIILSLTVGANPASPQPTLLTHPGSPTNLGKLLVEIARVSNQPIDTSSADLNAPVALKLVEAPFWDALEQIANQTNHRLVATGAGPRISFVSGGYRPIPMSVSGPFRFSVGRVATRLDLADGKSQTEIVVDAVWEPKFKAFYAELLSRVLMARLPDGSVIPTLDAGAGKMDVADMGHSITVKLGAIPRRIANIRELSGQLRLTGSTQLLLFTFDPSKTGATSRQAREDVAVVLNRFDRHDRIWTAEVEYIYPTDMPEFESFQSYLRDNEVWLQKGLGAKIRPIGLEIGAERRGRTTVTYRFRENDRERFVVGNPADWRFGLRTPGRIVDLDVPFTLRDIPLP